MLKLGRLQVLSHTGLNPSQHSLIARFSVAMYGERGGTNHFRHSRESQITVNSQFFLSSVLLAVGKPAYRRITATNWTGDKQDKQHFTNRRQINDVLYLLTVLTQWLNIVSISLICVLVYEVKWTEWKVNVFISLGINTIVIVIVFIKHLTSSSWNNLHVHSSMILIQNTNACIKKYESKKQMQLNLQLRT